MLMNLPIYMDYNATTPVDPRVLEVMLPYFGDIFGNPSSRGHLFGRRAEQSTDLARQQVARLIGADAQEIVWTSGASESINLAIKGVAGRYSESGNHIVSAITEHKAVLNVIKRLGDEGMRGTVIGVDAYGVVDVDELADALTDDTILVSIMMANNETGTIQPIEKIGKMCHDRGVLFHTDATQAVGKLPIDVQAMSIDLLSCSAHKMYGPKGVGALYVRRRDPRVRLLPLIDGGGQERGLRSGTLNVPGIVGFGEAAKICEETMEAESLRISQLRNNLHQALALLIPELSLNGHPLQRLPNTLNLSSQAFRENVLFFDGINVAVSASSACSSGSNVPSYVLMAMGLNEEKARAAIRFSLGRFSGQDEIDYLIDECKRTFAIAGRVPSISF